MMNDSRLWDDADLHRLALLVGKAEAQHGLRCVALTFGPPGGPKAERALHGFCVSKADGYRSLFQKQELKTGRSIAQVAGTEILFSRAASNAGLTAFFIDNLMFQPVLGQPFIDAFRRILNQSGLQNAFISHFQLLARTDHFTNIFAKEVFKDGEKCMLAREIHVAAAAIHTQSKKEIPSFHQIVEQISTLGSDVLELAVKPISASVPLIKRCALPVLQMATNAQAAYAWANRNQPHRSTNVWVGAMNNLVTHAVESMNWEQPSPLVEAARLDLTESIHQPRRPPIHQQSSEEFRL